MSSDCAPFYGVDCDIYVDGKPYAVLYRDGEIWRGGTCVAKLYEDGEVWQDGRKVAKVYGDGSIYQNGSQVGSVFGDGELWSGSRMVGKVYPRGEKAREPEAQVEKPEESPRRDDRDAPASGKAVGVAVGAVAVAGGGGGIIVPVAVVAALCTAIALVMFSKTYWTSFIFEEPGKFTDQGSPEYYLTLACFVVPPAIALYEQITRTVRDRLSAGSSYLYGILCVGVAVLVSIALAMEALGQVRYVIGDIYVMAAYESAAQVALRALAIVIGVPLVAVGAALIPALVGTVVGRAVSSRVPADAAGTARDGGAGGGARKLLLGCVALIVIVAVVQIAMAFQEAQASGTDGGASMASGGDPVNAASGDTAVTTGSPANGAAAGTGVVAGTRGADSGYILPTSASAYLSEADLADLDADHAVLALNEIYARHGREFSTPAIAAYFESQSWYEPMYAPDEFSDAALSDVERANVDTIVTYLEARGWRAHVPFS